jgi:outer membrane protein TolC
MKGFITYILPGLLLVSPMLAGEEGSPNAAPMVLTLEKAIEVALGQNKDVLIADQDRLKSDAQIGEAWSGALPQVSFAGGYTRNIQKPVMFIPPNTPVLNPTNKTQSIAFASNNSYQMGIQLAQPLFSRKVGVALEIAKTYDQFTQEGYRATQQSVVLNVKKTFYGVLLSRRLVEANRQALDVVRANYENVKSLYNNGNAAEFDLLRAEVQLANTEPTLISAENNFVLAKNGLKALLSIPLEQEIDIEGDFVFEPVDAAVLNESARTAVSQNPLLSQLTLQESMLEKNISIERANYYPTLALTGAYMWQTQDNTFQFSDYNWAKILTVGVSMSFPIFDGFRTSERIQEAVTDKEKVRYTRLKVEEGLRIQVQSGELKMAEAQRRIEGQEKNVGQAKKAVHIAQTRFKSGVGTQLELMDAQVAMTRTQTNYAQAIYDFLVAKAEWQYAMGAEK